MVLCIIESERDDEMAVSLREILKRTDKGMVGVFSSYAFTIVLVVLLCLSGCKKESASDAPEVAPEPTSAQPGTEPDAGLSVADSVGEQAPAETAPTSRVLLTVDGVPITQEQLEQRVQMRLRQVKARSPAMTPQLVAQLRAEFSGQELDNLVVEQLLDVEATKAGIRVADEEIIARLKQMASTQGAGGDDSLDKLKAMVESQGMTFEELQSKVRKGLAFQKLVEIRSEGKATVTDEEAQQYYTKNTSQFERPDEIRASHILIKCDPTDANDVRVAAKAKAEGLLQQVKDGADFAELAREHSDCPSKARGGDLDFFGKGKMVKPFEDAAFALEAGEISDVVETRFGYHIIRVADKREAGLAAFEDVKADIIRRLTQQKQSAAVKNYIQSLRDKAQIVHMEPETTVPGPPAAPAGPATQ